MSLGTVNTLNVKSVTATTPSLLDTAVNAELVTLQGLPTPAQNIQVYNYTSATISSALTFICLITYTLYVNQSSS